MINKGGGRNKQLDMDNLSHKLFNAYIQKPLDKVLESIMGEIIIPYQEKGLTCYTSRIIQTCLQKMKMGLVNDHRRRKKSWEKNITF